MNTNLIDLAGQYISLRRNGTTHTGCCPFHGERTPSFHVYPDGHFHCYGCGAHGDAIDFLSKIEDIPLGEAMRRLKAEQGSGPATYSQSRLLGVAGLETCSTVSSGVAGLETCSTYEFIPMAQVRAAEKRVEETSLYRFFWRNFRLKDITRVLAQYAVGASRYENPQGGLAIAFPYINTRQEVIDVKIMHFSPTTGSRKDAPALQGELTQTWAMAQARKSHLRAPWTLFGAHLIPANAHKPLGIVESEKSAIIASILMPDYLWLATGGKNNLTAQRLEECRLRQTVLFPDADAIKEWTDTARSLQKQGFSIEVDSSLRREAQGPHDDIADILLRRHRKMLSDNWGDILGLHPELVSFADRLDLHPVHLE